MATIPSAVSLAPAELDVLDVLDHHGVPRAAEDWSVFPFSDQGSWFGFALPFNDTPRSGFTGPFLFSTGRWLSRQLVRLELHDLDRGQPIVFAGADGSRAHRHPGYLELHGETSEWNVRQQLWFDEARLALVRVEIQARTARPHRLLISLRGDHFGTDTQSQVHDRRLKLETAGGESISILVDGGGQAWQVEASLYHLNVQEVSFDRAGDSFAFTYALHHQMPSDSVVDRSQLLARLRDSVQSRARNQQRWRGYLAAIPSQASQPRRLLGVKAIETLVANWRAPAGRLHHGGLFPSGNVAYFNGYWAWDSWKHAVALRRFDPQLAKAQIRAMFHHQGRTGMIPDVVYLDGREDNWRNTKPPLAGWAVEAVAETTMDMDFVAELYPKLVDYHGFWYRERDHDQDGLCEYGSTDGTVEAARWESGMDNAVRFDDAIMLQNGEGAWSMDRASVDLNSFLYRDKLALARLADMLGKPAASRQWRSQAEQLATKIRTRMFNRQTGWFHDLRLNGAGFVATQGPEGWAPLWAGVADADQADAIRGTMLNERKFRTHLPFPTVARDDPEFSEGYWRGLVWLDQAYFGIEGLRNYGFDQAGTELEDQLIAHLEGATLSGVPLYENYAPLTGKGRNVAHFSWTAAHLLMLIAHDEGPPI